MKRVFCFLCALLIVFPTLIMPVFAAESIDSGDAFGPQSIVFDPAAITPSKYYFEFAGSGDERKLFFFSENEIVRVSSNTFYVTGPLDNVVFKEAASYNTQLNSLLYLMYSPYSEFFLLEGATTVTKPTLSMSGELYYTFNNYAACRTNSDALVQLLRDSGYSKAILDTSVTVYDATADNYVICETNIDNRHLYALTTIRSTGYGFYYSTDDAGLYPTLTNTVKNCALVTFYFDELWEACRFLTDGNPENLVAVSDMPVTSISSFYYSSCDIVTSDGTLIRPAAAITEDSIVPPASDDPTTPGGGTSDYPEFVAPDFDDPNQLTGFLGGLEALMKYLFIPNVETLSERFDDMLRGFSLGEDFLWFTSLISTIFDQSSATPPVFTIDLSVGRGSFSWTNETGDAARVKIMDFGWYAEYKPSVDLFMSAFLWLGFLWMIYKNFPSILNGLSVDRVVGLATSSVENAYDTHLRKTGKGGKSE